MMSKQWVSSDQDGDVVERLPWFLYLVGGNISDRPKSWVTVPRGSSDVMRRILPDRGRIGMVGNLLEKLIVIPSTALL